METRRQGGGPEAASGKSKETNKKVLRPGEDRESRESAPSLPLAEARSMASLSSTVGSKLKSIGERGPRILDAKARSRLQKGMGRFRSKVAAVAAALGALAAAGPISERLTGEGLEETGQAAALETDDVTVAESPSIRTDKLKLSAEEHAAFLRSLAEADKAIADASPSLIPTGYEDEYPDPFVTVEAPVELVKETDYDLRQRRRSESRLRGKNLAAGLMKKTRGLDGMTNEQIANLADEASRKENGELDNDAFNALFDELKSTATGAAKAELSGGAEKMKEYANLGATNKAIDAFNGMIRYDMMDRNSDEFQSTLTGRGLTYEALNDEAGMQDFEAAFKKFNAGEKAHVLRSLEEYAKKTSFLRDENGKEIEDVQLSEFVKKLQEFIKRESPK